MVHGATTGHLNRLPRTLPADGSSVMPGQFLLGSVTEPSVPPTVLATYPTSTGKPSPRAGAGQCRHQS